MATTPVKGFGPFEFTDSKGKQVSIPLTALYFNSQGVLASNDPVWSAYLSSAPASALATYMIGDGLLAPMPAPSPFPAMVVRAATPGPGGNNITISVTVSTAPTSPPTNDPTLTPFTLEVSETDTYSNQTAASIVTALASGGLVQISGPVDVSGVPISQSGNLTPSGSQAEFQVMGSGSPGTVFVLVAKNGNGADAQNTSVQVTPNVTSPPGPNASTFNLTVSWSRTITGVTLATLDSIVQSEFSYEIGVTRPASGAYSVPANGNTQLSGGSASTSASAILITGL